MTGTPLTPPADRSGPVVVIRSEERMHIATEVVPVRRAVLRVETTTEQVLVPVTVTRQHARIEFVDVDPAAAVPVDLEHPPAGATGAWLVLTADEPVVTTRPVPVERVRLVTVWARDDQDIHLQLAHEEVTPAQSPAPPGQQTSAP